MLPTPKIPFDPLEEPRRCFGRGAPSTCLRQIRIVLEILPLDHLKGGDQKNQSSSPNVTLFTMPKNKAQGCMVNAAIEPFEIPTMPIPTSAKPWLF